MSVVEIPKGAPDDDYRGPGRPAWFPVTEWGTGKRLKPLIRCNCGHLSGIGLHHVHADGTVTASYFHATKAQHAQGDDTGCGWHVYLKLKDYDWGEFPPRQK